MERILVLLFVLLVVVHCKPVRDEKASQPKSVGESNDYQALTDKIESLKNVVETLKDAVGRQKDAKAVAKPKKEIDEVSDLLADLEEAVLEESVKKEDSSVKKKDVKKADSSVKKADSSVKKADSSVKKADSSAKKKDASAKKTDANVNFFSRMQKEDEAEIVTPKLDEDEEDTLGEIMKKTETEYEKKKQVKDVKNAILDIKHDLQKTKDAFAEMKRHYSDIAEDEPLDETSINKFESIRSVMNNVVGGLKDLKTQLAASNMDEMDDESTSSCTYCMVSDNIKELHELDETKSLLKDMKGQLQEVSDNIKDLHGLAITKKEDAREMAETIEKQERYMNEMEKQMDTEEEDENEKKKEKRAVEDVVLDIKSDLTRTKEAFAEMRKDYSSIVKGHPLDESSRNKLEVVKSDMHGVVDDLKYLKDLKAEITAPKSDERQDQATSDDMNEAVEVFLLEDTKNQLKEASDNIHELHELAVAMKEEEEKDEEENERRNAKDALLNIKKDFHRIREAFAEMKNDYSTMKDEPLEETSINKFISIRRVMNNVVREFKDLKDKLIAPKLEGMNDESTADDSDDDVSSILIDVKDELKQVSDTVQNLHDLAVAKKEGDQEMSVVMEKEKENAREMEMKMEMVAKDEEEKEKKEKGDMGEGKVEKRDEEMEIAIEVEKQKRDMGKVEIKLDMDKKIKDKKDEEDMEELDLMKNKMIDVIHEMKRIKDNIKKRKSTPVQAKDDGTKQGKDRLAIIKEKLDQIKLEVKDLGQSRKNN